jgi:ABC-type bacteriocin/lantibiotic exporter with double-glycine peptidase domain
MDYINNFKHFYQSDDYSCGQKCALMVLEAMIPYYHSAHFGTSRTTDDYSRAVGALNAFLQCSPERGTYQKDLVRALRISTQYLSTPLTTKIVSMAKSENRATRLVMPTIQQYLDAGWLGIACVDFNQHWVVIRGIRGKRIYLADPDPNGVKYTTINKFKHRLGAGSIVFVKTKGT